MTSKKLMMILILTGLGAASFAASFLLSSWLGGSGGAKGPGTGAGGEPRAAGQTGEPTLALADLAGGIGPLRPRESLLEEMIRELKYMRSQARRKETELKEREKRIRMAQELLKKEAQELERLRGQLATHLIRVKEAKAQLRRSRILIAQQEQERLKRTAAIYEKMDSASGAEILRNMCQGKQEEDAVKILYFMSERSAAKLLGEMSDKALAARLCQRMKTIQDGSSPAGAGS